MRDLINENLSIIRNPNSHAQERRAALASLKRLADTGSQRAKDAISELAIGGNQDASAIVRDQQPNPTDELSPEARALLAATGHTHLADVEDDGFLAFVHERGIEPCSRDYDVLRSEWRNFREPGEAYLRTEYLAYDGDSTQWARLKYWAYLWRRHLASWCAMPRTAGVIPELPIALRFADEMVTRLLAHSDTLPWMRDSVELFMTVAMNQQSQAATEMIAKHGPKATDLWRPDPNHCGGMITEGELMELGFPHGDDGSRRLYDRMAAIRQLFTTGVYEYDGADLAVEEHQRGEPHRKGTR